MEKLTKMELEKENSVRSLIDKVKDVVSKYEAKNIYKESFIDNENVLYYSVTLWGDDDKRDLAFYVELYKKSNQLHPIICNTRKYILHETLNMDSVDIAINDLINN